MNKIRIINLTINSISIPLFVDNICFHGANIPNLLRSMNVKAMDSKMQRTMITISPTT